MVVALICYIKLVHDKGYHTSDLGWSYYIGWVTVVGYAFEIGYFAFLSVVLCKTGDRKDYVPVN